VGSRRPFCNFGDFIRGLCEFSLNERQVWKMIKHWGKRTSPSIMTPKEQQVIRIAEQQNEAEKEKGARNARLVI
jgi:hypothetical protein